MFSINSNFSISRLNNAEITAFFMNVQKAIATSDPTKLGVTSILPAYGGKLQELIDRVYVSQGSEFTAAMKAADDRRCLIFRRIRLRLQMVEVAEQNEALLAIQDVVRTHLLSKYVATVTSKAYQERSSILKGFILDLNEKLGESGIETLGLADDITALEDANNAFIAAYAQRTAEKAEGNMGVTARLRDEMYDLQLDRRGECREGHRLPGVHRPRQRPAQRCEEAPRTAPQQWRHRGRGRLEHRRRGRPGRRLERWQQWSQ